MAKCLLCTSSSARVWDTYKELFCSFGFIICVCLCMFLPLCFGLCCFSCLLRAAFGVIIRIIIIISS